MPLAPGEVEKPTGDNEIGREMHFRVSGEQMSSLSSSSLNVVFKTLLKICNLLALFHQVEAL